MDKDITIGDKYGPAMEIDDQDEADRYFEKCVQHTLSFGYKDYDRAKAEQIERSNLGYYAGYYSHKVRERVERLFRCTHPIFGSASNGPPTDREAFEVGQKRAKKARH